MTALVRAKLFECPPSIAYEASVNGAPAKPISGTRPASSALICRMASSTGAILAELREAGGDVIGADWRTPIDEAWTKIGADRAIQGNLDPTILLAPIQRILAATDDVLTRAGGRPGHIFNLGHGILPMTPLEHVQAVARYVHQQTQT